MENTAELIINQIWQDAEYFGFEAIKSKKDHYLNMVLALQKIDKEYEYKESKMNESNPL